MRNKSNAARNIRARVKLKRRKNEKKSFSFVHVHVQNENNECVFARLHFSIFRFNTETLEQRDIQIVWYCVVS